MPADLTQKNINLGADIVRATDDLMDAVERLVALKSEKESAGIVWDDAALASAQSTMHVEGSHLDNALGSADTLNTWLVTNFHDDNFQRCRP